MESVDAVSTPVRLAHGALALLKAGCHLGMMSWSWCGVMLHRPAVQVLSVNGFVNRKAVYLNVSLRCRIHSQVLHWWQDERRERVALSSDLMRLGNLLQTSELLLETLQLAADGDDVAAAASSGERVAHGADLLAVGPGVDELVLAVLQRVHDWLEGVLHFGGGLVVFLEDDVTVDCRRGEHEENGYEELHGGVVSGVWIRLCG
jgi:hypothetical protein